MNKDNYKVSLYQTDSSLAEIDVDDEYSSQDFDHFETLMHDSFDENHFDQLSVALLDKKKIYEESVDKAVRSAETKDVVQATRNMSDYYLYTTMVAKVAQKSQSAIDKLTNLQ